MKLQPHELLLAELHQLLRAAALGDMAAVTRYEYLTIGEIAARAKALHDAEVERLQNMPPSGAPWLTVEDGDVRVEIPLGRIAP